MRLHVVSLPHTQTTRAFDWCAFTAKVRRLGAMLHASDHKMVLYAGIENEAICEEHVPVVTTSDLYRWFGGEWDNGRAFDQWADDTPCWQEMTDHAIQEIRARLEPGDAIGVIGGKRQERLAIAFPKTPILEWGVGYGGVLNRSHKAYESNAWRHYVAGSRYDEDGHFFDTVIPNSFADDDFTYAETKDDYLLYLGRMTPRKGLAVVEELAKRHRVVTAGQGTIRVPGAEHLGLVLGDEKKELLARARAVLVPSLYLEPFGGVAVEAMLSGTPVITTDWGAFPETVEHGLSGFRCGTLGEFVRAVENVGDLKPFQIHQYAYSKFSCGNVAAQYDAWLRKIQLLDAEGWFTLN